MKLLLLVRVMNPIRIQDSEGKRYKVHWEQFWIHIREENVRHSSGGRISKGPKAANITIEWNIYAQLRNLQTYFICSSSRLSFIVWAAAEEVCLFTSLIRWNKKQNVLKSLRVLLVSDSKFIHTTGCRTI